ncbi:MAG: bifunctional ornithine acetyltransferase/N-acetylglutamate synthase, partial [Rhodobacteraceae bacterium]|nr:bifunctional ornithine acetyltransferase/N-acetylglutamate synthase [Paracoccaceae bacterium]
MSKKTGKQDTAALAVRLERKQAQLKEARLRLRALEAALSENDGVSPFAPTEMPELPEVAGVRMAAVEAGIRYSGRLDVALFEICEGASLAGVFTTSKTRAAPVLWCEERLSALPEAKQEQTKGKQAKGKQAKGPLAIVINAGNANAFTGDNGRQGVEATAKATAKTLGIDAGRVFIASTGVIGEPLPAERITSKLGDLKKFLSPDAWDDAARAIMTTDTYPKLASVTVDIAGAPVTLAGVAKGSGMIAPDMATMLSFLFTDANVSQELLQRLLRDLSEESFNA